MATKSETIDGTRALTEVDIDRAVAIDRAYSGHSRRHFFERRFAAKKAHPNDYVLIGVGTGGQLLGFVVAHVLHGEFGQKDAVAVLDALGVDPQHRGRGVGHSLVNGLLQQCRKQGVRSVQLEADWRSHGLLQFFDDTGFELAPRLILERAVAEVREDVSEEA